MQRLLFILLATVTISFYSCKKYEEGPVISFRSAEKRVAGNWRIASYTVDGVDSMAVVEALNLQGRFTFASYDKDYNGQLLVGTDDDRNVSIGTWNFGRKKNKIYLFLANNTLFEGTQQIPLRDVWIISRLKHEEMWLQLDKDGKQYELRFKPYSL